MKPKRLISLLVAVCMMITMLPLSAVTAFAADTSSIPVYEANDGTYKYYYSINADGTATIEYFRGPVKPTNHFYYVDIPETLDKYTVTAIGDRAFWECTSLKEVTIPESVTSIGEDAFQICHNLTSVTIKNAATSIGDYAFCQCQSLETLSWDENITTIGKDASIGDHAFYGCIRLKTLSLGEKIKTIGEKAFWDCERLDNVTIPDSVTSIGNSAFDFCYDLTTLSLGENLETIGGDAFNIYDGVFCGCTNLSKITIPKKVKKIEPYTFAGCSLLKSITLPAGLTSFEASLDGCSPDCVIYYNGNEHDADTLRENNPVLEDAVQKGHKLLYRCNVTFDANGGTLTDKGGNPTDHAVVSAYKTQKINADDLTAIPNPTRAGYNFTGWYTKDGTSLNVNEITTKDMTKDITFYARWELAPKAPVCYPLTLKDGVITSVTVPGKDGADPEDITEIVKKNANEDGSFNVPEGATVSVAFDKDAFADSGLKFGHWDITGLDDPNAYQDKESFAFEMPAKGVTLKAMTQDASIEDDEPNVLGTAAIIGTAAVGTAVLGYQAYSLGAEFAGKLMALPYFPSNRSALAMMLWEDAGKPMPESELLYPDVEQEAQDMDLQHAARWAMENELIPDLNDEGTAPEEMKFFPANPVSKLDVLNAWQKAQELKNN